MPIHYGDKVRIRHQHTGHRLHSHRIDYPGGSRQQQVTAWGGRDGGDWWRFKPGHGHGGGHSRDGQPVRGGEIVRLEHVDTRKNLHSHRIPAHVSRGQHEVSCFQEGNAGDRNDNWRVECRGHLDRGEHFKLIHVDTNGALHSHRIKYPFMDQFEVTTFLQRDMNDNWSVEEVEHTHGHKGQNINPVGAVVAGLVGLTVGTAAVIASSNQQPPPAYTPPVVVQQQAYPPQQQAYPPQQQGYPPQQQAYPPQQQSYQPPPVVVQAPVVVQQAPVQLPQPNSTIFVTSMNSNKNLRLINEAVDAKGGQGKFAKWFVQPSSFLRLSAVGTPGQFLAVRPNKAGHGPGGKGCEISVHGTAYPGIVTFSHAHGNGYIASDPQGNVYIAKVAQPGDRATHFRFNSC